MKIRNTILNRFAHVQTAALAAIAATALLSTPAHAFDNDNDGDDFAFELARSSALPTGVLSNAHGRVKIESLGPVEIMKVKVWGLPPNTDFDLFVIQVPNAPFGEAWYQGDIETNQNGVGYGQFVGRFNIETFIMSNGSAPAPADPFHDPNRIRDASQNLPIAPIQIYHLGLWFNSPKDAANAGAQANVTPFNGEHDAGVQVLNSGTGEFTPPADGPLKRVTTSGN